MDLNVLLKECKKFGLNMQLVNKTVYIYSKFEKWSFKNGDGKITLRHHHSYSKNSTTEYHTQFKDYVEPHELALYIYNHGQAKYTNRFVDFEYSPEIKRRKKCSRRKRDIH